MTLKSAPPQLAYSFPDDALLDAEQTAAYLHLHVQTVYELCGLAEGDPERIPHCRFKNRIRVPFWGLKNYIAARAGAPLPPSSAASVLSRH